MSTLTNCKEGQHNKGVKRKAEPILTRKVLVKVVPSSTEKLSDETKLYGKVEETAWNPDYCRENEVFSELSRLRKLESEITGIRQRLYEDYSKILAEETSLHKTLSDIQRRKKQVESCLQDLQMKLTGFRPQIEEKEIELKDTHEKAEKYRQALFTSFRKNFDELQEVKSQHQKDLVRLGSETEKRVQLKRDLETSEQNLKSEREKTLCQTCLVNTRNTLILPCMHYSYCDDCLLICQKKSSTCPTCRGPITALLLCK